MSKILSGDSAGEFQRWEAPSVNQNPVDGQDSDVPIMVSRGELEEIHQQAHAKGYQMGRWEGMNAGREDLEAQCVRIQQLVEAFSQPLKQLDEQVERELVLLAGAIASQLVHREITTDPGILNDVVRSAVTALHSSARRVDVHLNPEDAELVRDTLKSPDSDQQWRIVEDSAMHSGDVRVVASNTFIDASLRTRLYRIIADRLQIDASEVADELEQDD